jgi:hypothetical protein
VIYAEHFHTSAIRNSLVFENAQLNRIGNKMKQLLRSYALILNAARDFHHCTSKRGIVLFNIRKRLSDSDISPAHL